MFIRASSARVGGLRVERVAGEALAWMPLAIAAAYLAVFAVRFPELVRHVYWNSDAAMLAVAAQTIHRGSVAVFAHCSWLAELWAMVATRSLPFHRELWEAAPALLTLAAVGVLARSVGRLAGWWAGAMAAALAVAVSPLVDFSRVAPDFHGDVPIVSVLLALQLLRVARRPPRAWTLPAGVCLGAVAGIVLASDELLVVVALIPFALCGAALAARRETRRSGAFVLATAALALLVGSLAAPLSRDLGLDVVVSPAAPLRFAKVSELGANLGRLLGLIVQVGGGDYSQAGWQHLRLAPASLLALACGALVLLAFAAPAPLFVRVCRARRLDEYAAWVGFWTLSLAGNCAGYALSADGDQWGFYLVPVVYGLAATVPLAFARTARRRRLAGLGIAVLTAGALVSLVGRFDGFGPLPPLARYASRVAAIARAQHARFGFTADYWDAAALSWSTGMVLQVEPLWYCGAPGSLCPFLFNVVSSAYQPYAARSFVVQPARARPGSEAVDGLGLVDASSTFLDTGSGSRLGRPRAVYHLGAAFTVDVYGHDLAAGLDDHSDSSWAPTLAYGRGFDRAEPYQGATGRWLIEDGSLDIRTGVVSTCSLAAVAFGNAGPRTLELLDGKRVLGRARVASSAAALRLGPFRLPAGSSRLRLVAEPGPAGLGPADPRQGSVFLASLTLTTTPAVLPVARAAALR